MTYWTVNAYDGNKRITAGKRKFKTKEAAIRHGNAVINKGGILGKTGIALAYGRSFNIKPQYHGD